MPAQSPPAPPHSRWQEVWYLKFNDPAANRALWLRLTLLRSANGFRRVAETWAVHFQRAPGSRDVTKVAIKQTHDIDGFEAAAGGVVRAGGCEFGPTHTRGRITSQGKTIAWDLKLLPGHDASFNLVPETLRRAGVVRNTAVTEHEDLRASGTVTVGSEADAQTSEWKDAAGMLAHLSGPRHGHSWVWGHCNLFVDGTGRPVPFLFEGLSARAQVVGSLASPRLSTFFFHYEGKAYAFNSLWDAIRAKSSSTLTDWNFQADQGDLSFRGQAHADIKDFAGLTYEDTDGSLLYCANSKLSNLEVHVYRRGKLENTFYSHGTTAFEVVSREKNPYVPLLV